MVISLKEPSPPQCHICCVLENKKLLLKSRGNCPGIETIKPESDEVLRYLPGRYVVIFVVLRHLVGGIDNSQQVFAGSSVACVF